MPSNKILTALTTATALSALTVLSGCAGLVGGDGSPANPNTGRRAEDVLASRNVVHAPAPMPTPSAAPARNPGALRDGIKLYDDGDFNGAIRRLALVDVPAESIPNRLIALKYTAFSYCVTSRPTQCRQAFDKAFKLDPSFDLGPGEHSHPLWGPVFLKASQK